MNILKASKEELIKDGLTTKQAEYLMTIIETYSPIDLDQLYAYLKDDDGMTSLRKGAIAKYIKKKQKEQPIETIETVEPIVPSEALEIDPEEEIEKEYVDLCKDDNAMNLVEEHCSEKRRVDIEGRIAFMQKQLSLVCSELELIRKLARKYFD